MAKVLVIELPDDYDLHAGLQLVKAALVDGPIDHCRAFAAVHDKADDVLAVFATADVPGVDG